MHGYSGAHSVLQPINSFCFRDGISRQPVYVKCHYLQQQAVLKKSLTCQAALLKTDHLLAHRPCPPVFHESAKMRTLYDSESFAVLHLLPDVPHDLELPEGVPGLARHGFEIVDKRTGKELYLDGLWAEMFQQRIEAWQEKTPTQEEVEDALESYTKLAQNPVVVH